ncbi:hypothetical protein LJB82_00630 [Desulfovibrio sp. OttesenSCG-928-M16]|nr:hypothetical protein [Desulfovibrio sp. OttesenSCG-928-M16]
MTTRTEFLTKYHSISPEIIFGMPNDNDEIIIHCSDKNAKIALSTIKNECKCKIIGMHIYHTGGDISDIKDIRIINSDKLTHYLGAKIVCFLFAQDTGTQNSAIETLKSLGIFSFIMYSSQSILKQKSRKMDSWVFMHDLDRVIFAYDLLSDEESKMNYIRYIKSRCTGDIGYIKRDSYNQY